MNYLERATILLSLAEELKAAGSVCSETHFQKITFVLQELFNVPLAFDFRLYKHGPHSFGLADFITEMRADELISLEPHPAYGVSIRPAPHSEIVFDISPEAREQHLPFIKYVAQRFASVGDVDLERLATALWVAREIPDRPIEERATRLTQLRPHTSIEESRRATADGEAFRQDVLATFH